MLGSIQTYKDRLQDCCRHCTALRDMQYEGSAERPEREATFHQTIQLFSPIVNSIRFSWKKRVLHFGKASKATAMKALQVFGACPGHFNSQPAAALKG